MKSLIYYNPNVVTHPRNLHLPGMRKFSGFFQIFNPSVVALDRTGTIKTPVRTHSLFPIPPMKRCGNTFEELCDERARQILRSADALGLPIRVLWSGGIDSTLVLVSLLKHANTDQKQRITVLLSDHSIAENPNFYRDHIHGKLAVDSSILFPYSLGDEFLIVGGEHNDQLFGSDVMSKLIARFGQDVIHAPYDPSLLKIFFMEKLHDAEITDFYMDLFDRLYQAAPVALDTLFLRVWWINFAMKWQSVFIRIVAFTAPSNDASITRSYLEERYIQFYNTEDFQLWSLNNLDKRIKDTWATYKWVCKDIIYNFTKDAEYRDHKTKKASLYNIFTQLPQRNFIDTNVVFYEHLPPEDYLVPDNDFL